VPEARRGPSAPATHSTARFMMAGESERKSGKSGKER